MKTYTLPCLDFIEWSVAEPQSIEQCIWSPNAAPAATVQGLYIKDKAIVFRLCSFAAPTRAVNTRPDSSVWEDSCLECFFSFDDVHYVNLEANSNSALLAFFGADRADRKSLRSMGITMPQVKAAKRDEGWELTFSIALETIEALWGHSVKSGDCFTANFYSCGDKTPAPHYAAWNKVETETPDFHRPEFFGKVIIG